MGLAHRSVGQAESSAAFGLAEGERPVAGIVVAPSMGIEWVGGPGLGVTRNGAPTAVSRTSSLSAALCATGFPAN